LAQAQSNRAPRGRTRDFPDAERLVKRLVARELTLSFVPDVEQAQAIAAQLVFARSLADFKIKIAGLAKPAPEKALGFLS
jgi:hypothetical protein